MLGNATVYHLINDSLMPELDVYQNDKLFSKIWQEWRDQLSKKFLHPALAFEPVNLPYTTELKNDWDLLNKISDSIAERPPLYLLFEFYPQQHRLRFYIVLMWQSLHIQYYSLNMMIKAEESVQHQQYILMNYLMELEQLMADNEQKLQNSSEPQIRKVFHQLMLFFWLKLEREEKELIHIKSLRYFREELEYSLRTIDSDTENLQKHLIKQLEEKPQDKIPQLRLEDFNKMAPNEIIADIKEDLLEISEAVKHMAEPMEMEADTYLKPKDAAKYLGIATSTLAKWRNDRKFKKLRQVGNRWEYSREELHKLKSS